MGTSYHRNGFVRDEDAQLSIRAKVVNYGLGCFGGIRGYWNQRRNELFVFRLDEHTKRLCESARILGIEPPLGANEMAEIITELLRRNEFRADCYIRPLIYVDSDELSPTLNDVPIAFSAYAMPLGKYLSSDAIKCCISSWRRVPDNAIPARAKPTAAYLNSALARAEAKRHGYDEAILLTDAGTVSEGSAEHLFLVRRGELASPPSTADNLDGITRRTLITLAADPAVGVPFAERTISRTELYVAEEIFLCGTGAEVTPVSHVDQRKIGAGTIGPVTAKLGKLFADVVRGDVPRYESWLTPVWGDRAAIARSA